MNFFANLSMKIGFFFIFTIFVAIAVKFLGIKTEIEIKHLIISHWRFALGVGFGFFLGGKLKNWYVGFFAAIIVIFLLYFLPFDILTEVGL